MRADKGPANALIVVAKRPAPGRTKTRLSPPLSARQAAVLYECFLQDTLALVRQIPAAHPVIAYLPPAAKPYFRQLAPDFELLPQRGPDLGARLDNIITCFLNRGCRRVAVINSDAPTLPAAHLSMAFELLAEAETDAVFGPSDDGGYYLIGLKRPAPRLLREVRMSTPTVLADTLALAAHENLRVKLLPPWYDVDDAASLGRLQAELAQAPPGVARHTRALLGRYSFAPADSSSGGSVK